MKDKNDRNKHIIETARLKVTVADAGAELISIFDKEKKREILWQADDAYWKRHAPILFPNVGKTYGNQFRYNGKTYPTNQHGFARDMEFFYVMGDTEKTVHLLTATEETMERYPFPFGLEVSHQVKDNQLLVKWVVKNMGYEPMFCTIGGHPAFNVPAMDENGVIGRQEDYYLTFEKKLSSLTYLLLDPETGTADTEKNYELKLENGRCFIGRDRFQKDALIFDNGQIKKAGIAFPDGTPYLTMICQGFPNFGIWQAPGAPFICLEPWWGRCDNYGFEGDLDEKPGIIRVNPQKTFEAFYTITVE
ncbi:MAG: aldose 1-epimerase family protein [Lachnospiraceae bacterium]|nr:aldose 1-epimerase family protein [Lachnospiraceae bacterium]